MQSFPRKVFEDRDTSLETMGLWPKGGMVQIQQLAPDDE